MLSRQVRNRKAVVSNVANRVCSARLFSTSPAPTFPPIGVGKGFALPALRTVRAVFPHTALQSVVSSSGVSRVQPGCVKSEQPGLGEEGDRPPLTPLSSADTMRSVQTEASAHDQSRASAPCVALAGTAGALCAPIMSCTHPPSCPPSLGAALLSALFVAHRHCGTMRALTPAARSHARQVSPLTLRCLPNIPSPTTPCARTSLCQSPQRVRPVEASPHMSRLAATRRRIGFVILRAARSLPAAPHPASRRRSCLQLHAM